MLEEIETHTNCTVVVCKDTETGKIDISWFDNTMPPMQILDINKGEDK